MAFGGFNVARAARLGLVAAFLAGMLWAHSVWAAGVDSVCYGIPSKGSLENGVALPESGKNFEPFTGLAIMLGRTYVHSTVKSIVVVAYAELGKQFPDKQFMYGETGWEEGGKFRPHKTHRNGTSVDFMVPVLDNKGKSVPLPASVFNKFGYNLEFDKNGKYEDLTIDFEALSAHIYFLNGAARKQKVSIQRVIFDPRLQPLLFETKYGKLLKGKLKFNAK